GQDQGQLGGRRDDRRRALPRLAGRREGRPRGPRHLRGEGRRAGAQREHPGAVHPGPLPGALPDLRVRQPGGPGARRGRGDRPRGVHRLGRPHAPQPGPPRRDARPGHRPGTHRRADRHRRRVHGRHHVVVAPAPGRPVGAADRAGRHRPARPAVRADPAAAPSPRAGPVTRLRSSAGTEPTTPARAHTPVVTTAGALVWRRRDGELQVQLVHRPRYDDWSWPKGKVETGESLPGTAVREVAEETGRQIVLGRPLPGLQYLTPDGSVKRVHYWAARRARKKHDAESLRARVPVAPVDRTEVDRTVWLPVAEAARRLTRSSDRGPLESLV